MWGNLQLADFDIASTWQIGYHRSIALAIEINIKGRDETMKTLTDQNITLAKPFGKYIGVDTSVADWSVPEEIADEDSECIENNEAPLADFLGKQSTIQVDGKCIHKASILNQIFTSDALSKDRLKRVQGLTAGISSEGHMINCDNYKQQWQCTNNSDNVITNNCDNVQTIVTM